MGVEPRVFALVLGRLTDAEEVSVDGDGLRRVDHTVRLAEESAALRSDILALLDEAGYTPPRAREFPARLDAEEEQITQMLRLLERDEAVVRLKEDLYFSASNLSSLQEKLIGFLDREGQITPQQFKEMTGASRKFSIPLAEYFDRRKITMRVGDVRKPRRRG